MENKDQLGAYKLGTYMYILDDFSGSSLGAALA